MSDIYVNVRRLTWTIRAGLALSAAGLLWMAWPSRDADASYVPTIVHPAFSQRPRPRILVDEGHLNTHTAGGRYRPFARLLMRDGFSVTGSEGRITPETLQACDVFVIVNALGYSGLARHLANLAGFERLVRVDPDAFTSAEADALASWIRDGGRTLIVADHAPAGSAMRKLASAFGVEMTGWWAEDRGSAEITFSESNGGLGDHAIVRGRSEAERVRAVTTFTGQALKAPPGAAVLLRLTEAAREYPYRQSREEEGRSAAGLAQAVALEYGRGRVVVMGEAAALTAQRITVSGAEPVLIGMNRGGIDNQQFALNVIHWLIGLLE